MTALRGVHDEHGAVFEERDGRAVVAHFGRPDRAHHAVRNVVGVIEYAYDVLEITGDDRVEYVDNAISNVVPTAEGSGVYALLLTPQGRIRTDMYVYNAGERLLVFFPPGLGEEIATEWAEKTFIQDVEIEVVTDAFAVFGVHGPKATEKVASVFTEGTPTEPLTFVRGSMTGVGVTVVRTDSPTGEVGYEVICQAADAADVYDTLENRGLNAAPFGFLTWESLTLEAGTPLFESELRDRLPNNLGMANAIDYDKGCFVGQEVVSRVQNRGQPNKRLVGLTLESTPEPGATVFDGDRTVGEVTRAMDSPTLESPIALALVDYELKAGDTNELAVQIDGTPRDATLESLPFVEGSGQSQRAPASPVTDPKTESDGSESA